MGPSYYEIGLAEQDQWLAQKLEELRLIVDALQHESDHHREQISALLDGLDAWAGRIQRLEALPGVAEALAAADTEGDK